MSAKAGRRAPIALVAAVLLALPAAGSAGQRGDTIVQFGWVHSHPLDDNTPPRNTLRDSALFPVLGVDSTFRSDEIATDAGSADTLGLIVKHFLSDQWALNLTVGYPPTSRLRATGTVAPTGPTGLLINLDTGRPEFNPVASARQWSPIILLERHFGAPDAPLRPFLAAGGTVVFFTEVGFSDAFDEAVNRRFGVPLAAAAGRTGPTRLDVALDPVLAPVVAGGLGFRLSERWGLTAQLAFIPLETTATVTLDAEDGTRLGTSRTRLRFDPLVVSVLLGYRFPG